MIRVATYNIRKCVGLDWRRRPDRIMRVLGELGADIVALQEADRRLGKRPATLAADELLEMTGLRMARLPGGGRSSGWHGNAILVREGISIHGTACVNLPSLEPRGALVVDVEIGGFGLRIVGVHFGLRSSNRLQQAKALIRELQARDDGIATVILGDLNEWRSGSGAVAELSKSFRPSPPQPSFHTSAPIAALDRIFVGPGLMIETAEVHQSESARRGSDHLPVWADIAPTSPLQRTASRQREATPFPA